MARTLSVSRSVGEDERRLETRLRELATYAPIAWDLWEEVVP